MPAPPSSSPPFDQQPEETPVTSAAPGPDGLDSTVPITVPLPPGAGVAGTPGGYSPLPWSGRADIPPPRPPTFHPYDVGDPPSSFRRVVLAVVATAVLVCGGALVTGYAYLRPDRSTSASTGQPERTIEETATSEPTIETSSPRQEPTRPPPQSPSRSTAPADPGLPNAHTSTQSPEETEETVRPTESPRSSTPAKPPAERLEPLPGHFQAIPDFAADVSHVGVNGQGLIHMIAQPGENVGFKVPLSSGASTTTIRLAKQSAPGSADIRVQLIVDGGHQLRAQIKNDRLYLGATTSTADVLKRGIPLNGAVELEFRIRNGKAQLAANGRAVAETTARDGAVPILEALVKNPDTTQSSARVTTSMPDIAVYERRAGQDAKAAEPPSRSRGTASLTS